jgi:DNA-binding GntR family transcriptional regulator
MDISEHRTMRQIVVDKLRQAISTGHLIPGQKLVYSDIAKELNVSVTPIREAMKTLEALGLVTIRPYRTTYISCLTTDEIQQIYELRKLLEGWATRLAAKHISQEELSYLHGIMKARDKEISILSSSDDDTLRSNSIVSLQHLHDQFHMSLYEASGNKYISQLIGLLRGHLSNYFPIIERYSIKRIHEAQRQHYEILTACEHRNPELAEGLMQEHLAKTVSVLLEHIEANIPHENDPGNKKREHAINTTADSVHR